MKKNSQSKIPIVCGPTATGKTNFAIKLAKAKNGELINADSRQVYKYLDIGTNKGATDFKKNYILNIANEELTLPLHVIEDIPIHLLSFLDPDKTFSVYNFQKYTYALIEKLLSENKLPIIVGGTGLYIDSLYKGYQLSNIRNELKESLSLKSVDELQIMLQELDKQIFLKLNNSDSNNPRRLINLISKLQYANNNQITISNKQKYTFQLFYPKYNWEELKEKIHNRVETMFETGLIEETNKVLAMGFSTDSVGLQTMGYKEITAPPATLLRKEKGNSYQKDLRYIIERVQIAHRQYARRQRTWFEGKGRGYTFSYF